MHEQNLKIQVNFGANINKHKKYVRSMITSRSNAIPQVNKNIQPYRFTNFY